MKEFLFLFLIMVLMGAIVYGYTYSHEMAHVQIYRYYGIDSEIHMNFPWSAYVVPVGNVSLASEHYDSMNYMHGLNEIFGYNISWMIFSVFTVGVIYFLVNAGRLDNENKGNV